jgi:hypothetical protein
MEKHPWSGVIAVLDRESIDGRIIPADVVAKWSATEKNPIPLIHQDSMTIAGSLEKVEVVDGMLRGAGQSFEKLESGTPLAVVIDKMIVLPKPHQGTVKSAELRALYITATPAWVECKVD